MTEDRAMFQGEEEPHEQVNIPKAPRLRPRAMPFVEVPDFSLPPPMAKEPLLYVRLNTSILFKGVHKAIKRRN